MAGGKHGRGITVGTVAVLLLTIAVGGGLLGTLSRLRGDTVVEIDSSKIIQALTLQDGAPALSLEDIPITVRRESEPGGDAPMQIAVTAAPVTTPEPQPKTYTLTWGGTVYLEKEVRQSGYYSDAKTYDFREVLAALRDAASADVSVVGFHNLVMPEKKVSDLIAPAAALDMLRLGGFQKVSLGFDQCYDQGQEGLLSTISAAEICGLQTLGAYRDAAEAGNRLLSLGDRQIAILQYSAGLSGKGAKQLKQDGLSACVPQADSAQIAEDISRARRNGADLVLVGIDWGASAKSSPNKTQTQLCQEIAQAGADAIIGSGSQNVQSALWLDGGSGRNVFCAYNVGALLCSSRKNGNVAGILLHFHLEEDAGGLRIQSVTYTPTYTWRYKLDSQYSYRVIPANRPAPDGMDDQAESLARAAQTVEKAVGGSIQAERNESSD